MTGDNQQIYSIKTTALRYPERPEPLPEFLQLDPGYLRSLPGLIKCVAITLDMLCFITLLLIGRTLYFSGTFWSLIVCSTAITTSLTLLILYLFHVVDVLVQIPWILSEMIFCFCWSIFYFIVGSVLAITSSTYKHFGFGFAALCAFGAMSAYGFDCFLKFLSWKHDEIAHGGKDNQIYINTVELPANRETNRTV